MGTFFSKSLKSKYIGLLFSFWGGLRKKDSIYNNKD